MTQQELDELDRLEETQEFMISDPAYARYRELITKLVEHRKSLTAML